MSLEKSHSKGGATFRFLKGYNDHIREREPLKVFICAFWVQVTPERKMIIGATSGVAENPRVPLQGKEWGPLDNVTHIT